MSEPDPVLDMKGMTMEEISLLLKFIYTGEVMVMTMMMLNIVIMMSRASFMIMLVTNLLFEVRPHLITGGDRQGQCGAVLGGGQRVENRRADQVEQFKGGGQPGTNYRG